MNHVDLEIIHDTKNRMRLKLVRGLRDVDSAINYIQKGGIYSCSYNARLNTLLLMYEKQTSYEVIARVSSIYAIQHGLQYVHVLNYLRPETAISASGKLAFIAILVNTGMQLFLQNHPMTTVANWCAIGTTIGTIIEHGYQEISKRGTFDPEVMSVVYLINAVNRGQALFATPGAWFLTFGRHLIAERQREMMVKVVARKQEGTYTVSVLKTIDGRGKATLLQETISNLISTHSLPSGRYK